MTGLDPSRDTILSVSCILTNSNLEPLDSQGFNAVIHHTQDQLSKMSEWCVKTHGQSGLTLQCLSSTTDADTAASELLGYIQHFIPEPRRALLAGNSIHADRSFLMLPPWNTILNHLHYRLFDVSAMKEMVRRWASEEVLLAAPRKELKHTAREDVLESIQEAQYYKTLIERMHPGYEVRSRYPPAAMGSFHPPDGSSVATKVPKIGHGPPSVPDGTTEPGQQLLNMLRNNSTKTGDGGTIDEGFRTDVP
jgi:oligoribonuclease